MTKSLTETAGLSELASSIATHRTESSEKVLKNLKKLNIKSEKIYETIIHCYLFCGFPAVIETLKLFKTHFPEFKSEYQGYDILKYNSSGITNCKLVYKNNFKKLIANMMDLSPEMKEWMIIEGYGKVMGRKCLNLKEREFLNLSILSTIFYKNQLHSHLKGCINLGASNSDILYVLKKIKKFTGNENFCKAVKLLNQIAK
ncbi:MAG: hypothetical protein JNJ56_11870 [Ignavibacteria bacterium]|nr:hypothetical protein [Ignavibacteria bacterium]